LKTRHKRLSDYVGNTPLLPIEEGKITVWCKAEFLNPGGSVKDRMATFILNDAEKRKVIKKGSVLCEATSGNTGIAFAMLAAERGYNMKIVMPSNMSVERKKMFGYYGADLIEVEAGDFDGAIALRDKLCRENKWFNCDQFHNELNIAAHYYTTGCEIFDEWDQWEIPEVLVAGSGTGGSIMGIAKRLRPRWKDMKVVVVEPSESPVMSGGKPGLHGIMGIGDGSKYLVDLDRVDDIVCIPTDIAQARARMLARQGLFVGVSAGANVEASFRYCRDNKLRTALTILPDRGSRYFSVL
jgi:cysteine synthase A